MTSTNLSMIALLVGAAESQKVHPWAALATLTLISEVAGDLQFPDIKATDIHVVRAEKSFYRPSYPRGSSISSRPVPVGQEQTAVQCSVQGAENDVCRQGVSAGGLRRAFLWG